MAVTMTSAVMVVVSCCIRATDSLDGKMLVARIVLVVSYVGMTEAVEAADLVAMHLVQCVVSCLTDCRVGTMVVLRIDSRAGIVVDGIHKKPTA